jgi:hypothetical protein
MANHSVTTQSSLTIEQPKRLLPAFVGETFTAANELALGLTAGCRTFRKSMEGLEKTVEGVEQVTSLMLAQQRKRLLAEYEEA